MKLSDLDSWSRNHFDYFLDAVRIYLGVGLMFKGISFLTHPAALSASFNGSSFESLVPFVPWLHIIGGAFLAAGLFTRIAAITQIPILFGAVFMVNLPQLDTIRGREAVEFSALVLFLVVLIAIKGAGPLSLGQRLRKTEPKHSWIADHPDVFADLIRIYLGIGLFVKGMFIMDHRDEFLSLISGSPQIPMMLITAAHYVIPVHFVGGVLLALGLISRVAAIAQIPPLIGAIFYAFLPGFALLEMRQSLEFTALVTFLFALISVFGAGRLSIENAGRKPVALDPALQPVH